MSKLINCDLWSDNNGVHINAHAGGIIEFKGVYYWYGEDKTEGWEGRLAYHGVHCYKSTNMVRWEDEGIVLKCVEDKESPISKGKRIERPKVLYNDMTEKFVMWFHSTDEGHTIAKSGCAVSDSPLGPFEFVGAKWPNAGVWPLNMFDENKRPARLIESKNYSELKFLDSENKDITKYNLLGRDFERGQMARDMQLFKDDDGTAYHIYASEHNSTLHIAKLTDDYLDHSDEYVRVFPNRWMEAPAMFKRNGKYYLLMSGCTSWDPNAARAAVGESPFGPWIELSNPCKGKNKFNGHDEQTTFGCQSTYVFYIDKEDRYIAMFDEWHPENFIDSRYVWLDIEFDEIVGYRIPWKDSIRL